MNVLSPFLSLRTPAYAMLLALGLSSAAHARPAAYELGQPFPHVENRSLDPQWRVYVFEHLGVRYFQINDTFGHLHTIFAEGNGALLVLPAGLDAANVEQVMATPHNGVAQCGGCTGAIVLGSQNLAEEMRSEASGTERGALIYQDSTLEIRATENAGHQVAWRIVTMPSQSSTRKVASP